MKFIPHLGTRELSGQWTPVTASFLATVYMFRNVHPYKSHQPRIVHFGRSSLCEVHPVVATPLETALLTTHNFFRCSARRV